MPGEPRSPGHPSSSATSPAHGKGATTRPAPVLRSEFADDPEMTELIGIFLDELPARIDAMRAAADASRLDALITMAHQLKGSAGGYGYSPIGLAAGKVEHRLRTGGADPALALDAVGRELSDLIEMCRAAIRGR